MTYSELLPQLIQNHQIAPVLLEPFHIPSGMIRMLDVITMLGQ